MARRSNSDEGMKYLFIAVGVALLLPSLIISFISFQKLRTQYLESNTARRVMDIKRLIKPMVFAGGLTILCAFISIDLIFGKASTPLSKSGGIAIITAWLVFAYFFARHFAVLYLGIVIDAGRDIVIFPFDMQSYTINDYLSFRFITDFCNVDTVPLSSIVKLTRGHGTDLYLHGKFGSRGIVMSNKQKRDECLSSIQESVKRKGLLLAEIESY